jgi:hypothetical protein
LAWETAAYDLNANCVSIIPELLTRKFSHIAVTWNVGPVLCEHSAAVWIDFAKRDGAHSGSFKAEAKSADT